MVSRIGNDRVVLQVLRFSCVLKALEVLYNVQM